MSSRCCVCGAGGLAPHLAVAGDAGEAGLIPTTDSFGTALADILRCPVCDHRQLAAMPSEESLAEAYGEAESADYVEEEEGQRATARAVLERLSPHAPIPEVPVPDDLGPRANWVGVAAPRRLLDLGCWVGFLLDEASSSPTWQPEGVEPSGFAADYARGTLGLSVQQTDLFDAELDEASFSAIVMADVIEHLIEPGAALRRCRELLIEGGAVALVLPDSGSALARAMGRRWWSVIPTHVQYFTRSSLARLLDREGYDLLEVATSPKAFTIRYYLRRLAGYSEGLAAAAIGAAERAGVADRIWAPDFRDRMIVIARRRPQA